MDWEIDKSLPLPRYVQVKRRLLSILDGWEDLDAPFHTDNKLCELFSVSKITVRKAMSELVEAGLLRRVRGVGTFVVSQKVPEHFDLSQNFIDQWAAHGKALSFHIRTMQKQSCSSKVSSAYGWAVGEALVYIERIRKGRALPISIDYRYVDPVVVNGCSDKELESKSLLDLASDCFVIDKVEIHIEASRASDDNADDLELLPGDPVLIRHLIYRDSEGATKISGRSIYRADQVMYKMEYNISEGQRPDLVLMSGGLGFGLSPPPSNLKTKLS